MISMLKKEDSNNVVGGRWREKTPSCSILISGFASMYGKKCG